MIEIRLHGLGGQGIVTAAEILATAFFYEGNFAQAVPLFGVERRGAPVEAFIREDKKIIRLRSQIYNPDKIIIFSDHQLILDIAQIGAKPTTEFFVYSDKSKEELSQKLKTKNIFVISKNELEKNIKNVRVINTAILSYFISQTKLASLSSINKAIKNKFSSEIATSNIEATKIGFQMTKK
ncbi:MAG: 2-oxoacid:acceptor oxidoreductase family protein [bacterium]